MTSQRPWENRRWPCLLILLALCLSGCVRFQSQPLSPVQSALNFDARNLDDAQFKRFLEKNLHREISPWPPASFDLTNLVLAALFYHSDMDVARAKWAGSKAGKNIAAERPNPTLSIAPGYDTTTSIPSPWLATAALDIPIETAGKRGYRIAQATQLSEAALLNIASAAWTVRSRVRQRMVDLYIATESEALLEQQQSLQKENLRLIETQSEAGAISTFEVTQARIAADSGLFLLRDAERQSAEARVQLADAVGIPAHALDNIDLSFAELDAMPADIPDDKERRQVLLTRPDILAALAEYAASQSALQLEIAKQFPDVHLSPGYEFDQGDNKWSLGLSVTLPVLNHNKGAIEEAVAKRAEAAANFNALQARVTADIDRAVAGYRVALQKVKDAESLRLNLLKQEKSLEAMLDAGEISKADLVGLRLQFSASSLTRLDAIAKSQQALGLLEDALQNPFGISESTWKIPPDRSEHGTVVNHP